MSIRFFFFVYRSLPRNILRAQTNNELQINITGGREIRLENLSETRVLKINNNGKNKCQVVRASPSHTCRGYKQNDDDV